MGQQSTYVGGANTFMQTSYVDQQGTALAGDLAFAADYNMIEACTVKMPGGQEGDILPVGLALTSSVSAAAFRPGLTNLDVSPVTATTTPSQLFGVMVRNQSCKTDASGASGWYDGDIADVLVVTRVGGRIWAKAGNASTVGNYAYVVIKDTSGHGLPNGTFCGSEIAGLAVATRASLVGTPVTISGLSAITDGAFNITVDGTETKITGINLTQVTSVTTLASVLQAALQLGGASVGVTANGSDGLTTYSASTGATQTITVASAPDAGTGTDISTLIGLSAGAGAVATDGTDGAATPDTILTTNFVWLTATAAGNPGLLMLVS